MLKIITIALIFTFIFLSSSASVKAKTLCIAHRGGSAYAPENTISAFENAIKIGADYIELDVHLSKDGYPVVIHDENLDRTTDGKGPVKDKNLAELKELDGGSWFSDNFKGEKIPSLEEVMTLAKNKIGIVIEIKNCKDLQDGIEEKIIKFIREKDMVKDIIIISFSQDRIKKVNELDEEIATGILYGGDVSEPYKMAQNIGADYLSPYWKSGTENMIKEAHSNNIKVSLWTVNEPEIMKKLIEIGADAITTDKPDLLLEELGRKNH